MATLERSSLYKPPETRIIDGQPVCLRDVCVHTINMGDVEDPDLFVAQPICEWQDSDAGHWIMAHAVETPYWIRESDPTSFGFRYQIVARLTEQNHTYWKLRFAK